MRLTRAALPMLSLLGTLCWLGPAAATDVPNNTTVQGRLLDDAGNALSDPVDIGVRIFPNGAGGSPIFEELHRNVPLSDGVFSVVIGDGDFQVGDYDAGTFDARDRYLELEVEAEVLTPRLPFRTVAYAFQAQSSESSATVGNLAADDLVTGVTAGTGLTGGGTSGDVTLDVDFAATQKRVSGTCSAGSSIRVIASSGAVTCEIDSQGVTNVTAGRGLGRTGATATPTLNVDDAVLSSGGPLICVANTDPERALGTHHFCALSLIGGSGNCEVTGSSGGSWTLRANCGTTTTSICLATCF